MQSKWDAIRGNAGFFITMAVCLLVIAICGYVFLFDEEQTPAPTSSPAVEHAPVAASVPEPHPQQPVPQPDHQEPAPPQAEAVISIEEILADDTPVIMQAPQAIVPPLEGDVVAAFSVDALVYNPTLADWRIHDGVDISGQAGSSVLAACAGTVIAVEEDPLMGTTVTLKHEDGYHSTYANLQPEVPVHPGDAVAAGQIIGAVGTSAAAEADLSPHLHFSVTQNGDVVDPEEFLRK